MGNKFTGQSNLSETQIVSLEDIRELDVSGMTPDMQGERQSLLDQFQTESQPAAIEISRSRREVTEAQQNQDPQHKAQGVEGLESDNNPRVVVVQVSLRERAATLFQRVRQALSSEIQSVAADDHTTLSTDRDEEEEELHSGPLRRLARRVTSTGLQLVRTLAQGKRADSSSARPLSLLDAGLKKLKQLKDKLVDLTKPLWEPLLKPIQKCLEWCKNSLKRLSKKNSSNKKSNDESSTKNLLRRITDQDFRPRSQSNDPLITRVTKDLVSLLSEDGDSPDERKTFERLRRYLKEIEQVLVQYGEDVLEEREEIELSGEELHRQEQDQRERLVALLAGLDPTLKELILLAYENGELGDLPPSVLHSLADEQRRLS